MNHLPFINCCTAHDCILTATSLHFFCFINSSCLRIHGPSVHLAISSCCPPPRRPTVWPISLPPIVLLFKEGRTLGVPMGGNGDAFSVLPLFWGCGVRGAVAHPRHHRHQGSKNGLGWPQPGPKTEPPPHPTAQGTPRFVKRSLPPIIEPCCTGVWWGFDIRDFRNFPRFPQFFPSAFFRKKVYY